MRFYRGGFSRPLWLVVLLLVLTGALAGRWAGARVAALEERREMESYMAALLSQSGRLLTAADHALDAAARSPFAPCSPEDLAYLRRLVFSAYQVKDIGRVEDGRRRCSTMLGDAGGGRLTLSPDGLGVYADPGGPAMVRGDANVVLSAAALDPMQTPRYAYAVFRADPARRRFAPLYAYPADERLTRAFETPMDASAEDGAARRCDAGAGLCVALRSHVEAGGGGLARACLATALGALAGGCLGLGLALYGARDRSLAARLRKALRTGGLDRVYQPVVSIADGRLTGFEALLRWEVRKGDFVPPDVFIGKAEEKGLIRRLTAYVIDGVLADMGACLRAHPELSVNVNIAAADLREPGFVEGLERRLARAGVPPRQIGLELTERTAVDFAGSGGDLARLRAAGHRIYIDDFGAGYSSLAYLGETHVDAIKIDKAFTRTVGLAEGEAVSIVPQIVSMAREHGLDIVVEGVETEKQLACFRALDGALYGQGWLFGKPVPAEEARALAGAGRPGRRRARRRKPEPA